MKDNTINTFFALIRAGLWEKEVSLSVYDTIDYDTILLLSQDQSVVGLVAAGFEHVTDIKVPKEIILQFAGQALQLEQRNIKMNSFISEMVEKMRKANIYTLLVKGQGIAQCYERPLWRVSGDIDFYLNNDDYEKAKKFLLPLSLNVKPERRYSKEFGLSIDSWYVELHGSQRTGLSSNIDFVIDAVQRDVFYGGNVRSWLNGNTQVFLPGVDNDVFFVFTHIVKHYYKGEGICIRQVCDWCRLLWTYRNNIKVDLLEFRLRKASLLSEWKAFAALAVDSLGMPDNAIPLYSEKRVWKLKAEKILLFILNNTSPGRLKTAFTISKVFPLKALALLSGILFDVNWLKIRERCNST